MWFSIDSARMDFYWTCEKIWMNEKPRTLSEVCVRFISLIHSNTLWYTIRPMGRFSWDITSGTAVICHKRSRVHLRSTHCDCFGDKTSPEHAEWNTVPIQKCGNFDKQVDNFTTETRFIIQTWNNSYTVQQILHRTLTILLNRPIWVFQI